MNEEVEKTIRSIKNVVVYYFEIFIGVLVSPKTTFQELLDPKSQKYKISNKDKFDERPFFFVAISLALGVITASSFSIRNAPSDVTNQILISTIIPHLFLWLIYGMAFHFVAVKLGGKGELRQSISGFLYVLGTLHPILLFLAYLLSAIFPNAISYDLTLRNITTYSGTFVIPNYLRVDVLGYNIRALYYAINIILTSIYLYFPLSITHKLPLWKAIVLYAIGVIGIIVFSFAGVILDSLNLLVGEYETIQPIQ